MQKPLLPIENVLEELAGVLETGVNAVLVAPPGAGKTTRVPLALLEQPWALGKKLLMLEPRRLAARSSARYMAGLLGESVGHTIGYRMKQDTRVSSATRIEVITEGVLTRLLQEDPALEEVAIVIFDEFHERNLHADLGLALCLQAQGLLRPDLRVLVMSATLDSDRIAEVMGNAPVIVSQGRFYPVETRYMKEAAKGTGIRTLAGQGSRLGGFKLETIVAGAVVEALAQQKGDILVFLPGAGEIRRTENKLRELGLGSDVRVAPLHGSMSQEEQDRAIAPTDVNGCRKVVLATSIAETSLTVEGVRTVIDCGLMRVPRFSPRTGLTRLETIPVTLASAEQRRGRAGRVAPGVCYRLWTEHEERQLAPQGTPEIGEADLAALALELAAWGTTDPAELRWLDPPPAAAYRQARELLAQLGALSPGGAITPLGLRMAALGLHPRLARMLLMAAPLGHGWLACELAALLGERDPLRGASADADVRLRVEALHRQAHAAQRESAGAGGSGFAADPTVFRRIAEEAARWARALGVAERAAPAPDARDPDACGLLLAFAYPDRIAQRRPDGRYLLRNGRGAAFGAIQPLAAEDYIVAIELDDHGSDSRIELAAALSLQALETHCADQIELEETVYWDAETGSVKARKRQRLGAFTLRDIHLVKPDTNAVLEALINGIKEEGLGILPWTKSARQLQQRLDFMQRLDNRWPNLSDEALLQQLIDWLGPHIAGMKNKSDLQRLNMTSIIQDSLSWEQRKTLDEQAPTHFVVPSGSRLPIDYTDQAAPAVAVRLQEMFGLSETPRLGGGRVPLTLHLLSPASRPVQVTRDLRSFWQTAYFEIKKDLKGRYPKHYWPDDPNAAVPTNRVRPRS
ncbi:MAG: ATP-dependent helicase [Paenibacillus sp.]|nr:ATP-dependent helicase [Paenibacillus sp.]